jgi:hypothetical protein
MRGTVISCVHKLQRLDQNEIRAGLKTVSTASEPPNGEDVAFLMTEMVVWSLESGVWSLESGVWSLE